jgi:hypothetical protein
VLSHALLCCYAAARCLIACLPMRRAGQWECVRVPFDAMRFTFRGRTATRRDSGMTFAPVLRKRVCGLGVTLASAEHMPEVCPFRWASGDTVFGDVYTKAWMHGLVGGYWWSDCTGLLQQTVLRRMMQQVQPVRFVLVPGTVLVNKYCV